MTLLKDSYITKEGYIIKKTADNIDIINELKKELTVVPHQTFKIVNIKPTKFAVYQENEKYISLYVYSVVFTNRLTSCS